MLYSLHKVENKRAVAELEQYDNWNMAVKQAELIVKYDEAEEVWITDSRNDQDVFAVVDKEGIRYG